MKKLNVFLCVVCCLLFPGCLKTTEVVIHGGNNTLNVDQGLDAQASLELSNNMQGQIYGRGSVMDGQASKGSATDGENWTDAAGGGQVSAQANTDIGPGDGDQTVEVEPLPDPEPVLEPEE